MTVVKARSVCVCWKRSDRSESAQCFFRFARAGRFSFVILFFAYVHLASHVLVLSVLCIFKNPIPQRDPLKTTYEARPELVWADSTHPWMEACGLGQDNMLRGSAHDIRAQSEALCAFEEAQGAPHVLTTTAPDSQQDPGASSSQ